MYELRGIVPDAHDYSRSNIKNLAYKYYCNFNSKTTKIEKETLSTDQSIIITCPDKKKGAVLLNKSD